MNWWSFYHLAPFFPNLQSMISFPFWRITGYITAYVNESWALSKNHIALLSLTLSCHRALPWRSCSVNTDYSHSACLWLSLIDAYSVSVCPLLGRSGNTLILVGMETNPRACWEDAGSPQTQLCGRCRNTPPILRSIMGLRNAQFV